MRNFILLIRRFWNIILFLILEAFSISMISKSRSMQGMDITSSANSVSGYVYKKQNDVVYYFQLRRLNDSLLEENTRLRNLIADKSNIDSFTDVHAHIPITVKDTTAPPKDSTHGATFTPEGKVKVVKYADYHYIPARVINNSISNDRQNFITINRGTSDGVRKEMAVVTGNGIVGRVEYVSEHYASVVSVLSIARPVSAKLSDGTSSLFTEWTPGTSQFVDMKNVPQHAKVRRGDSIFTTGYSIYPENLLIGTVSKIDTMKATNTKKLLVRLSANFRNLQYVYVVGDKMAEERKAIEAKAKEVKKK